MVQFHTFALTVASAGATTRLDLAGLCKNSASSIYPGTTLVRWNGDMKIYISITEGS
jgi:hypothetical protein